VPRGLGDVYKRQTLDFTSKLVSQLLQIINTKQNHNMEDIYKDLKAIINKEFINKLDKFENVFDDCFYFSMEFLFPSINWEDIEEYKKNRKNK